MSAPPRPVHAPTSRPKPAPPGLEKADHELNLGEFQDVDTLTLSEASLVINALVAKRKMDRKNINETESVSLLCISFRLAPFAAEALFLDLE
jgi:hypothetical protein